MPLRADPDDGVMRPAVPEGGRPSPEPEARDDREPVDSEEVERLRGEDTARGVPVLPPSCSAAGDNDPTAGSGGPKKDACLGPGVGSMERGRPAPSDSTLLDRFRPVAGARRPVDGAGQLLAKRTGGSSVVARCSVAVPGADADETEEEEDSKDALRLSRPDPRPPPLRAAGDIRRSKPDAEPPAVEDEENDDEGTVGSGENMGAGVSRAEGTWPVVTLTEAPPSPSLSPAKAASSGNDASATGCSGLRTSVRPARTFDGFPPSDSPVAFSEACIAAFSLSA